MDGCVMQLAGNRSRGGIHGCNQSQSSRHITRKQNASQSHPRLHAHGRLAWTNFLQVDSDGHLMNLMTTPREFYSL